MNSPEIKPYKNEEGSKKEQVAKMFNNIAPKYDFLNHTLSLGIDIIWRKKAVKILKKSNPDKVLDIACGTGDFTIANLNSGAKQVLGLDISEGMVNVGIEKIKKKGLSDKIQMQVGDSEKINFKDTKSRWGSCSSTGSIMLNWRLIMAPPSVYNYVIIHELAHLVHMNHGPLFWKLVQELSPNYLKDKEWLKKNGKEIRRYIF